MSWTEADYKAAAHAMRPGREAIWDAVRRDAERECLYGVAPPCQHPDCLQAAFNRRAAGRIL